jgi:hypothetical protein
VLAIDGDDLIGDGDGRPELPIEHFVDTHDDTTAGTLRS